MCLHTGNIHEVLIPYPCVADAGVDVELMICDADELVIKLLRDTVVLLARKESVEPTLAGVVTVAELTEDNRCSVY